MPTQTLGLETSIVGISPIVARTIARNFERIDAAYSGRELPSKLETRFIGSGIIAARYLALNFKMIEDALINGVTKPLKLDFYYLCIGPTAGRLIYEQFKKIEIALNNGYTPHVNTTPRRVAGAAINGIFRVGETINITAQPIYQGYPAPTVSLRWQSRPNGGGAVTNIGNGNSLVLTAAHEGQNIRLQDMGTNAVGSTTWADDGWLGPVAALPVQNPPTAITAPTASPNRVFANQQITLSLGTWNDADTVTGVLMQGGVNRTAEIVNGVWTTSVAGAFTWTVTATNAAGSTPIVVSGTVDTAITGPIWETVLPTTLSIPASIDVPAGQSDVYIPITANRVDRNSFYGFMSRLSNVNGGVVNVGDDAAQRAAHSGLDTPYHWSPGDDMTHYFRLTRNTNLVAGWQFNVIITVRGLGGSYSARTVLVRVVEGAAHPNMPAQYHRPLRRLDLSQATRKNTFNPATLPLSDSGFLNGQPAWRTRLSHGYSQDGNGETGLYMNTERFPGKAQTPHSYDSAENALRLHTVAFPANDPAIYNNRVFRHQAAVIQGQTIDDVCGVDGVWRMVAKIPVRRYSWPAFWLIGRGANGATGGYTAWPPEIDILEKFNQAWGAADTPYTTTFGQHYGNAGSNNRIDNFGNEIEANQWIKDTGRMDWEYHSWACSVVYDPVDTRKSEVTFFFDDVEVGCQILFARHQDMVTQMQFFPIANVAVRIPSDQTYTPEQFDTDNGRGNTGDMLIRDIAYYPTGARMPAAALPLVAPAEPRMNFARRAATLSMPLTNVTETGFNATVASTRSYAAWRSRFPVGTRVRLTVTVDLKGATGAVFVRSADDDAFRLLSVDHASYNANGTYNIDFTVTAASSKPWFGFLSTANGATISVSNLVLTYPPDSNVMAGTSRNPPFSLNLNWLGPYDMSHSPFINQMKSAMPWGEWNGPDAFIAAGNINRNGDVISIPASGNMQTFALCNLPANSGASGHYRFTWSGTGTFAILGAVTNVTQVSANRIEFDYVANGSNSVTIRPTGVTAGPLTNTKLVHQSDWAADDAGQVFRSAWLNVVRNSRVLRFKDWQRTDNFVGSQDWADRTQVSAMTYMGANGIPVEVMCDLCNLVGADPWFCMPHNATEAFTTSFATLARSRLGANRHAYVELSNKIWDGNLSQFQYFRQQGRTLFNATDNEVTWEAYGGLSAQMASRWRAVWTGGDAARLHTVMQVWTDNHYAEGFMLNAPRWVALGGGRVAPRTVMTEYAVHGLMDGGLLYDFGEGAANAVTAVQGWIDAGLTDSQIFDRMALACRNKANAFAEGRTMEGEVEHWRYHLPIAQAAGLNMIMYEGGTHVVTPPNRNSVARWNQLYNDFHYSQQWATLFDDLINAWYGIVGVAGMFNRMNDVTKPGTNQNEGLLRFLGDTNPQWTAWTTQQNTRQGVTGRGTDTFVGSYEVN